MSARTDTNPLTQYLAEQADTTRERFAAQAAFLRANVATGTTDGHGNTVGTLIDALDKGAAR